MENAFRIPLLILGVKSSRDFSSNRARDKDIIDVKTAGPRVTRRAANIHLIRARFFDLYRITGAIWILTSIHKNANPLSKATLVLEHIALGKVLSFHNHRTLRRGAIGQVVPGYEARIVDEQGQPVPHGQVGRLAVEQLLREAP